MLLLDQLQIYCLIPCLCAQARCQVEVGHLNRRSCRRSRATFAWVLTTGAVHPRIWAPQLWFLLSPIDLSGNLFRTLWLNTQHSSSWAPWCRIASTFGLEQTWSRSGSARNQSGSASSTLLSFFNIFFSYLQFVPMGFWGFGVLGLENIKDMHDHFKSYLGSNENCSYKINN